MRVLVDSGSTGNNIDARECTARRIKIEAEDQSKELKIADGTVVKTEGRVQFVLKCGGYSGSEQGSSVDLTATCQTLALSPNPSS